MKLAENLIMYRKSKKLTQADIAQRIGVDVHTYQRYEYGERYPQLPLLIALANLYGISIDELVGHEVEGNEDS